MIKLKAFSTNLLCWKTNLSVQTGGMLLLSQAEKFRYLGVLFTQVVWNFLFRLPVTVTADAEDDSCMDDTSRPHYSFCLGCFFMPWSVEDVGRAALKPHSDHSGSSGRNTEALSHGNARLYTRLNKVHYRDPTVDTDLLCPLAAVLFQRVSSVWLLIARRLKDPHRDPVHAGERNSIAYLLYNFSPVPALQVNF